MKYLRHPEGDLWVEEGLRSVAFQRVTGRRVVIHDDWEPLSDDAIVVRGGRMANEDLAQNAVSVFLESRRRLKGICGGAAEPPATMAEIKGQLPYKGDWACEARLGDLRGAGIDVVMVDTPPHCVILLDLSELGDQWFHSPRTIKAWWAWDFLRPLFGSPQRIDA
jgi:hypothetical protein